MKKYTICLFLIFGLHFCKAEAQQYFSVELEEISFPGFPGFHSAATGEWDDKWIVIGGRRNGLHGFYSPLAFPTSNINNELYVIDPLTQQVYSYSADSLPEAIREPVTSSNQLFAQRDSMLYLLGGYGWSQSFGDFKTFPTLTAVDLKGLSNAIVNQQPIAPYFRQIQNNAFAVCGANMQQIDSVFYVVWGHRFDGIYNRSDTSGYFMQEYTHEVRKMKIADDGVNLSVQFLPSYTDTINFRRRDYNLVSQIMTDGSYGLTGFSGVFQKGVTLPHLESVNITPSGYNVNTSFQQMLSHYHSAVMPVYDSVSNTMHTIFFGGTAQYYIDSVTQGMVEDTVVPFVNTISRVCRDNTGAMTESVLPIRMPGLLGTNAEFMPSDSVSLIHGEIIRLNPIQQRVLAGYIIGGIESPAPNINDTDPSLSNASTRVFKVYIVPSLTSVEPEVVQPFSFRIFPNPVRDAAQLSMHATADMDAKTGLFTAHGQPVANLSDIAIRKGDNTYTLQLGDIAAGVYLLRVQSGRYAYVQKLVIR
jgi:hypothetical protein